MTDQIENEGVSAADPVKGAALAEPIENEILHKEIDLIQACITRMAHHSFLIKGWCISIVAVVLAFAGKSVDPLLLALIIFLPFISFWSLDTFFLRTEKMYRKMYLWILQERKLGNVENLYDLDPRNFEDKVDSYFKVMRSTTLSLFYGVLLVPIIIILIYQALQYDKTEITKSTTPAGSVVVTIPPLEVKMPPLIIEMPAIVIEAPDVTTQPSSTPVVIKKGKKDTEADGYSLNK